jgi:hypothetical protein
MKKSVSFVSAFAILAVAATANADMFAPVTESCQIHLGALGERYTVCLQLASFADGALGARVCSDKADTVNFDYDWMLFFGEGWYFDFSGKQAGNGCTELQIVPEILQYPVSSLEVYAEVRPSDCKQAKCIYQSGSIHLFRK